MYKYLIHDTLYMFFIYFCGTLYPKIRLPFTKPFAKYFAKPSAKPFETPSTTPFVMPHRQMRSPGCSAAIVTWRDCLSASSYRIV